MVISSGSIGLRVGGGAVSSGMRAYHLIVSSGLRGYHLDQGVSSGFRGYHLDQGGIIWFERVSSEYHLD
jgi:hypothetical protein